MLVNGLVTEPSNTSPLLANNNNENHLKEILSWMKIGSKSGVLWRVVILHSITRYWLQQRFLMSQCDEDTDVWEPRMTIIDGIMMSALNSLFSPVAKAELERKYRDNPGYKNELQRYW